MDIGYVQGRLLPMPANGYQAFPTADWEKEFELAQARNLSHVEWVVDKDTVSSNPIISKPDKVEELTSGTGVSVASLCLDFVMSHEDFSGFELFDYCLRYVDSAAKLAVPFVLLPFVDSSSLVYNRFPASDAKSLISLISEAMQGHGGKVLIESDLSPAQFGEYLDQFGKNVLINYDIGNSAAMGYPWREELGTYGSRVGCLHIKDRGYQGGPVFLGSGDAEWSEILGWWSSYRPKDSITTMQTFRDLQGVRVFDEQLAMVRSQLRFLNEGSNL